jgi:hypothetical protein
MLIVYIQARGYIYIYIHIYNCLRYHKRRRGKKRIKKNKGVLSTRYHKVPEREMEKGFGKGIEISMYGALHFGK